MSQLQTVTEMCRSEIKQTKVEMNKRFEGVESKITDQNNLIAEISARVWCGKFIWRITGFDQYFKQAKNGDLPALHSQPFYTGVPGQLFFLLFVLVAFEYLFDDHKNLYIYHTLVVPALKQKSKKALNIKNIFSLLFVTQLRL